ncbi:MAG: hypothetical protein ACOCVQ_03385 [Bacillota bacterium]
MIEGGLPRFQPRGYVTAAPYAKIGILFVLGIGLHNLPGGIAVGTSFVYPGQLGITPFR